MKKAKELLKTYLEQAKEAGIEDYIKNSFDLYGFFKDDYFDSEFVLNNKNTYLQKLKENNDTIEKIDNELKEIEDIRQEFNEAKDLIESFSCIKLTS